VRVFVALDIPNAVQRAIGKLIGKIQSTCPGARWVRTEGMHITLKFIGEASLATLEQVKAQLSAVHSAAPVEINFHNVGFFPDARRPRVFWAGMEATPNLSELAADIERGLEALGIPRETRPFRPHLTLARFKSQEGLARLQETLKSLAPFDFGSVRTAEFHLYHSRLKPSGAEYTKLETFRFAGDAR